MAVTIHQFPYNSDNYGVLIRDDATGQVACIDAGEAAAVLQALDDTRWALDALWITHWHHDHTDGMEELRAQTGCAVIGPSYDGGASLRYDTRVADGARFAFGSTEVVALHTPGHTLDMINYYMPEAGIIFTGDTLFAMGCGRVFEGTHQQMFESIKTLRALPPDTVVYAGHEYTEANARFALSVDPENSSLQTRAAHVAQLRSTGTPTLPTTIAEERATNPFMRYDNVSLRAHLGLEEAADQEVFSELRTRKDTF